MPNNIAKDTEIEDQFGEEESFKSESLSSLKGAGPKENLKAVTKDDIEKMNLVNSKLLRFNRMPTNVPKFMKIGTITDLEDPY